MNPPPLPAMPPPTPAAPPPPPPGAGAPIISVRNLSRRFGKVEAVRDVSFDIYRGQVVGFIGANGAGKTTTMRIMVTLDLPTAGSASVGGWDVVNFPSAVRSRVGWMPDAFGAHENTTVHEYLDFYARAFGFKHAQRVGRIAEVMDFTDLSPIADRMMNNALQGHGAAALPGPHAVARPGGAHPR